MSASTTLYLVRHAAHDRLDRVLCGRMPGVTLGDVGLRQAERLAERLGREPISRILTSPLERAQETAAPLAARLRIMPEITDAITEIDMGEWTGRSFDALGGDPRWQAWNEVRAGGRAPGGEAMQAVQDRALALIQRLRIEAPGGRIVLVSHSDVIKAMVAGLIGLSLDHYHRFEIGPASISTAVVWEGGGKVLSLNEASS